MSENADIDPVGRAIPELVDEIDRLNKRIEELEAAASYFEDQYEACKKERQRLACELHIAEQKSKIAQRRLGEAERLINAAVGYMSPEQVGRWQGVRAWLEEVDDE